MVPNYQYVTNRRMRYPTNTMNRSQDRFGGALVPFVVGGALGYAVGNNNNNNNYCPWCYPVYYRPNYYPVWPVPYNNNYFF